MTYNGSAHTPKPSVKLGSKTLASGSDYTLSYSNNTNAGTAKVTATGKGNYTGSKTVNFTINKAPITSAAISSIAAQTYTGKAITPNPSVALGNRNLVNNTDYILTYASNASAGESTAKVTVTGKGNYTGSKTVNFSIRYKLNYNLNSGTNAASNPITYKKDNAAITLANPVRVGYTFGGWHSDSAFKTKVTSIAKNSSGNKTLYAKWTPTSYGNISANSATRAANIKTMTARSKNYTNGGIAIVGTSYMSGWDAEITFNNLGFDAGKVYNFAIGGDKPSTMGTDQSYINMIAAKAPHVIIINGANDFAASPTDASKNTKLVNKTYNGQVNLIKNLRKALKAKGVSNPKFILSPSLKTPSRYHKSGVSCTADKGPVTCNLWKRVDSYNAKLKAFASANADTTYFDFQPSSAVDDFHNN